MLEERKLYWQNEIRSVMAPEFQNINFVIDLDTLGLLERYGLDALNLELRDQAVGTGFSLNYTANREYDTSNGTEEDNTNQEDENEYLNTYLQTFPYMSTAVDMYAALSGVPAASVASSFMLGASFASTLLEETPEERLYNYGVAGGTGVLALGGALGIALALKLNIEAAVAKDSILGTNVSAPIQIIETSSGIEMVQGNVKMLYLENFDQMSAPPPESTHHVEIIQNVDGNAKSINYVDASRNLVNQHDGDFRLTIPDSTSLITEFMYRQICYDHVTSTLLGSEIRRGDQRS